MADSHQQGIPRNVPPQQPARGVAGSHGVSTYGNLGAQSPRPAAQPQHGGSHGPPHIAPPPRMAPPAADTDPIPLDDDPWVVEDETKSDAPASATPVAAPAEAKQKIVYSHETHRSQHTYNRPLEPQGRNATRVKSFHSRYSDEGLEFIDRMINEWLESHPDVTIKFVTSTVMTFEGKIREPALVLNVWH